jgi:predicted anti-sigma-YlaC factor YlaD
MNCLEYREWLQQELDGAIAPAPAAAVEHMNACAECRALAATARAFEAGLAALPRAQPAPLLTASIVTAILDDRRQRMRLARRRVALTLGLAASILLLMLLGWMYQLPTPSKNHVAKNDAAPPDPGVPQLERRADEARAAVSALTERVAGQTTAQAKMLLAVANTIDLKPMTNLPAFSEWEEPFDPAAQSLKQATQTVASGIEPIARTTRRAFDFFVKELPVFDIPLGN